MTIKELKEELEVYDEDLEVMLAEQPNFPFEYLISKITSKENDEGEKVVYICEGSQKGYLDKEIFN